MKILTKEQILIIHRELIEVFGGKDGLIDEGLLDSALSSPFQTFGGQPLFISIQQKAARMCFGLLKNHPFVDGNKRIGVHTMLVLLSMNGIEVISPQKDLYEIILKVAASEASYDDLLSWVIKHTG
jgi:death-on-curing protein